MSLTDRVRRLRSRQPGVYPAPNHPRFDPLAKAGHVESWFVRANHPSERKALWLKGTILSPKGEPNRATADAWCIFFDGDEGRIFARRETVPVGDARLHSGTGGRLCAHIAGCDLDLGAAGSARGALEQGGSRCTWNIEWTADGSALAAPLSIFPYRFMVDGAFPKSKLLTPFPVIRLEGRVECFGDTFDVGGWYGMQGHNWGREHAWEYAWGQCLFPGAGGAPDCMVEGFTSRIRLAGVVTPPLSALVVRRGPDEHRFDRVFHFWRQDADILDTAWSLRLRGPTGEAHLRMEAGHRQMVCLGYRNPDGRMSYCMNSKLARVRLQVDFAGGGGFEHTSPHGGALELLRNEPDPRLGEVV